MTVRELRLAERWPLCDRCLLKGWVSGSPPTVWQASRSCRKIGSPDTRKPILKTKYLGRPTGWEDQRTETQHRPMWPFGDFGDPNRVPRSSPGEGAITKQLCHDQQVYDPQNLGPQRNKRRAEK